MQTGLGEEPFNLYLSKIASVESSLWLKGNSIFPIMKKGNAAFFMKQKKSCSKGKLTIHQFRCYLHLLYLRMPPNGIKPVVRHFKSMLNYLLIFSH